ncbi:uncharacterized protein G2W53_019595 [Senna tora]|uniref:Uncharacterized protein n=1 Tax=Senna tora TaxID=362788 RepID=A0A834TY38_9FABA|nr:uncharacterized protein G2W53_019595 [Senna tora]
MVEGAPTSEYQKQEAINKLSNASKVPVAAAAVRVIRSPGCEAKSSVAEAKARFNFEEEEEAFGFELSAAATAAKAEANPAMDTADWTRAFSRRALSFFFTLILLLLLVVLFP